MKTCTKCGEEKPLESFAKHRGRKDGHDTQCKDCKRSASSAYYKENRDEVKKKQATRYRENREQCLEWQRNYYYEHREENILKSRQYYRENKSRLNAQNTEYLRQNPHKGWESGYRERCKKWGLLPLVESFTKDELVKRWGDACMDCGAPFTDVDHVVPVVAGGPHALENCQPTCRACNLRRWREYQRAAIAAYVRREQ